MAPRDAFDDHRNRDYTDGRADESDDEGGSNEEILAGIQIADANQRQALLAAARREERDYASREMRRQTELTDELRNSVEAMEIMIQSQQRIDQLTRSLNEMRELHRRMVEAGIGQDESSDEEEEVVDTPDPDDDDEFDKADALRSEMSLGRSGSEDAVDSGVFELDDEDSDDGISNGKEGSNPISSAMVASSPATARKHGHT